MPILPVGSSAPYGTVGDILQLARVYCNDAAGPNGISGDLLSDSQPYTLTLLNSAWRELQDALADAGVETMVDETIITGLPAVTTIDPSISCWLDWTGYFPGSGTAQSAYALPQDFILPRGEMWERPTGSGSQFTKINAMDELPEGYQTDKLRWYIWRGDKVWFKGSTVSVDLKVSYISYLPDLTVTDSLTVPVMRCSKAMAYLIASEFCRPRGSEIADNLYALAQTEIDKITNRTARRKASITFRRKAFGSGY